MDDLDDDCFAPLTEAELAAVPAVDDAARDKGECVMPVPADAPGMPGAHRKLGKPSDRWSYRDAAGALLFEVWRFDPAGERKQFLPLSLWRDASGALRWRWKAVPAPRPLYRLDRIAANPDASVVICEGEKAAGAAARVFPKSVCVTSPTGSQAASKADWKPLAGRRVLVWPDADEPGGKYATAVARIVQGLGCEVSIIDAVALASTAPDGGKCEPVKGFDAADAVVEWQDIAALRKVAHGLVKHFEPEAAEEASTNIGLDAEIKRLASLLPIDYERERSAAAKKLRTRTFILDKLVSAARKADDSVPGQGRKLELREPEPWHEPVSGAALIGELEAAIERYVIMLKGAAFTTSLWILHTYCFDAFLCTPRLAITSPLARCGKTTLLDVLGQLVPRALPTGSITAAALFRTIELARPSLLIDEADTFLRDSEELRGVLDQGHRQGGQLLRTVGDDHEPRAFSVHSPAAIAMIGKLPGTLADRAVHIEMRRAARGEKVAKFRFGKTPELGELARKSARWIADNAGLIGKLEPEMPDAIYNRMADNWEPLLAIAEAAGPGVAGRARTVALAACGVEEEQSLGTLLLADIRDVFDDLRIDKLSSAELVESLAAMVERPWPECRHGKPINQNWLARRLRDFGIRPEMVGPKSRRVSGYSKPAFHDAFSRYLPETGFQGSHPHTSNVINELDEKQPSHQTKGCEVQNHANPLNLNEVRGCEVQNPETGARAHVTDDLGADGDTWGDRF